LNKFGNVPHSLVYGNFALKPGRTYTARRCWSHILIFADAWRACNSTALASKTGSDDIYSAHCINVRTYVELINVSLFPRVKDGVLSAKDRWNTHTVWR